MSGDFDAVIIGAGVGGLTCGAYLARAGMRVLVVEKHERVGGYAHAFSRGMYRFDCGIYSVPMGPEGFVRRCLSELGVNCATKFVELPHMCQIRLPGVTFDIPSRKGEFGRMLCERFPKERKHILHLLDYSSLLYQHMVDADFSEYSFLDHAHDFVKEHVEHPYRHFVEQSFTNPLLRKVLYSLWPFTGVSPSHAATVRSLMTIVVHLEEGSHFYAGGFSLLAKDLTSVIISHGGKVLTQSEVTGLITDRDRVRAVIISGDKQIEGRVFVSNVSPLLLHERLLPPEARNQLWIRRVKHLRPSVSAVAVYVGLKPGAWDLLPPCVTLWFSSADHDNIYSKAVGAQLPGPIEHLVMLHTPEGETNATLLVLAFANKRQSRFWRRDKERMAAQMLNTLYSIIPGLREAVAVTEIASPDTFERFTGNTDGALFGFDNSYGRYAEAKMPTETHLSNLYQVGHWGRSGSGVWNVMADGRAAARSILDSFG